MSFHTKVDGLTVCHKGDPVGHVTATLPDVCLPPDRVPVPYGNTARATSLTGGTVTVLVEGGNMAAHSASVLHGSTGDEPGVLGGVASGTVAAEASWLSYSNDVFLEGLPACRLTDKMLCNHRNTVAMAGYSTAWLPEWKAKMKERHRNDPELCQELLDMIDSFLNGNKDKGTGPNEAMRGLKERWSQQLRGDIPPGTRGWDTHEQEIVKTQKILQELLKAYDEYCSGYGSLPFAVRSWATAYPPQSREYTGPTEDRKPSKAGLPRPKGARKYGAYDTMRLWPNNVVGPSWRATAIVRKKPVVDIGRPNLLIPIGATALALGGSLIAMG
jgi:hypothetical protein